VTAEREKLRVGVLGIRASHVGVVERLQVVEVLGHEA
jgi:hypothetical protein